MDRVWTSGLRFQVVPQFFLATGTTPALGRASLLVSIIVEFQVTDDIQSNIGTVKFL